ncbi:MAG: 3-deoxy-D-manno-octulosonic acid kinase [Gammaproteobacteria bacterium]|nr:3-deoxy-D-manno-octulosonic acid kinase [Gammaproteobacteria bacterium]
MSLTNQLKIIKQGASTILYDANLIAEPALQLFDSDYHTNSEDQQNNSTLQARSMSSNAGVGRARVVYFEHENIPMVLKHYYRGGLMASIVKDKYIGIDIEKTRAFKEFRLLIKMQHLGLPVPGVIAARVEKGPLYFRADLITKEIENVETLAEILSAQKMAPELWKNVGVCIKSFHRHDVYHADLNARNILLSEAGEVYLIDFDNSHFRSASESWKMANLARLKRSLLKFRKNAANFNFDEKSWSMLLGGYKGESF